MGGDIVTDSGSVYFAHSHVAVDIGTEGAQFPWSESIHWIFCLVHVRMMHIKLALGLRQACCPINA